MTLPRHLWALVALVAGVLLAYAGTLGYPLVFDDAGVLGAQLGAQPRFFANATFAALGALGGGVPWQRVGNLLLHACTALALFAFCRNLMREKGQPAPFTGPLVAAGVFAVHPVTVYAVAYLAQRSIILATLFSVLSLDAWLRGLRSGRGAWFGASVALFALALLSKEHAVMLPAVAMALAIAMRSQICVNAPAMAAALIAQAALMVLGTVLAGAGVIGEVYEPFAGQVEQGQALHLRSALTQTLLFFRYGLTWLAPAPTWMSIDLRAELVGAFSLAGWAGAAAYLAWGALSVKLLWCGRCARVGFALALPWLLFLTEFAVVRLSEPLVLYRSYLWAPGLVILAAVFAEKLRPRVAVVFALMMCLLFVHVLRERLETFSSPLALWDDAVRKQGGRVLPFSDRAIANRGVALMRAGRLEDAKRDFDRAIVLNPRNPTTYFNRAVLFAWRGDMPRASADLAWARAHSK